MPICAYLTMQDLSGFFAYDHLTYEPLRELGWEVEEVAWTDSQVDWSRFAAVVIRSTWDYQNHPQKFLETLREIEASGTPLLNPCSICEWNLNKSYLRELAQRNVPIIPSLWPNKLDEAILRDSFQQLATSKIVVKPLVGANADNAFVLQQDDSAGRWGLAFEVYAKQSAIVQPFVDSIIAQGEYSLFYFNGEFSHCILKTPADGDFRGAGRTRW